MCQKLLQKGSRSRTWLLAAKVPEEGYETLSSISAAFLMLEQRSVDDKQARIRKASRCGFTCQMPNFARAIDNAK